MTEATDRFAELTRQGHQVFAAAVQAWEQAARSMAGAGRPGAQLPDVGASVDAAFDFAAQMLADQRDFTRTLMSAGAKAFAAAAQRPDADVSAETAEALGVQPAQDADQPGADVGAASAPATPEPETATPETATPEAAAPETPAPRKTTAAKKAAPGAAEATATEQAPAARKTAKKAAAKKTTAKKTAAQEPAKRATRRSGSGS